MSYRGALLKPSEKGQTRASRSARGFSNQSRYEVLKEKVRTWWEDRSKVGAALQEIRDQKLYKHEHETFEDFCKQEYGFERAHAYRLIGFAEVKATIEMSPIGDKVTRESQARALAPVPEEKRVEVLEETAKTGPVTAKRITETATKLETETVKAAKLKESVHLDKIGYPIPETILDDWQRAEEFLEVLAKITQVKSVVKSALEDKDVVFSEVNNTVLSTLTNAYDDLKRVLPYAVCTTCQGRTPKKCTTCKGRGFISKFFFQTCIPEEVRNIRKRAAGR